MFTPNKSGPIMPPTRVTRQTTLDILRKGKPGTATGKDTRDGDLGNTKEGWKDKRVD